MVAQRRPQGADSSISNQSVRQYIANLKAELVEARDSTPELNALRAQKLTAEIETIETKNRRIRKELIAVEDIEPQWALRLSRANLISRPRL
jgi:hypothetical protein